MPDETLEQQMEREAARQQQENPTGTGDNGTETAAPPENAQNTPSTETPAADAATGQEGGTNKQTQAANAPDFNALLTQYTNGTFKTHEELVSAMENLKRLDDLDKETNELRQKVADAPVFADDYERKRNELKLSGKSKEALRAFEQVNELGDLSQLDPIEAKVMKLVLVDGMGEKVARLKVAKEFPVDTTYDEDLEILQEDLRISSAADRKALEAFKAEVSTPAVNDSKLIDTFNEVEFTKSLNPVLENFQSTFNVLSTLNLGGKEGEPAATLNLNLADTDKAAMAQDIKEYMTTNKLPLTQDSINEAVTVASERYLYKNLTKISNDIWNKAESHFDKLFTEKYSNSGGKPRNPASATSQAQISAEEQAFKESLMGGKLK